MASAETASPLWVICGVSAVLPAMTQRQIAALLLPCAFPLPKNSNPFFVSGED